MVIAATVPNKTELTQKIAAGKTKIEKKDLPKKKYYIIFMNFQLVALGDHFPEGS